MDYPIHNRYNLRQFLVSLRYRTTKRRILVEVYHTPEHTIFVTREGRTKKVYDVIKTLHKYLFKYRRILTRPWVNVDINPGVLVECVKATPAKKK